MQLQDNVCNRCRTIRDSSKEPEQPFLMSVANNLDPESVPRYRNADSIMLDLPILTNIEERLIARVHVHYEIRQIRGGQRKYKGHVISFLRDTRKLFTTLPLLPANSDIVVLRPPQAQPGVDP
jgi:hypothetical protein